MGNHCVKGLVWPCLPVTKIRQMEVGTRAQKSENKQEMNRACDGVRVPKAILKQNSQDLANDDIQKVEEEREGRSQMPEMGELGQ